MNRIVITTILSGSLCLLSGCLEISYNSGAKLTLGGKRPEPKKLDDGYPTLESEIAEIMAEKELHSSDNNRHTMSLITTEPKRKGFKKFKRREK